MELRTKFSRRIPIQPNHGADFFANPSIIEHGGVFYCTVKRINFDRKKIWYNGDWDDIGSGYEPIRSDIFLLVMDTHYSILSVDNIDMKSVFDIDKSISYVEDVRLFHCAKRIMLLGTSVKRPSIELNGKTYCSGDNVYETFIGELAGNEVVHPYIFISPTSNSQEKNWIPVTSSTDQCKILTNLNMQSLILYNAGSRKVEATLAESIEPMAWEGWSGSSPLIPCKHGYVGIIHRRSSYPEVYQHMFIRCDDRFRVIRASKPFTFEGQAIEFCCGLAFQDETNDLIVSFSTWDSDAALGVCNFAEIDSLCKIELKSNKDLLDIGVASDDYYRTHYKDILACVRGNYRTIYKLKYDLLRMAQMLDIEQH